MSDNGHGHTHEYPREIEEDGPSSPLTMEQVTHQLRELRIEFRKARFLGEEQAAGMLQEVGELSGLVRNSEAARSEDARLIRVELAALRKGQGDLAEGQGRIAAELARGARQDSLHEEAITGVHRVVEATKADVALVRAKTFGWRALAAAAGYGVLKAIEHWIGG